ncbi:MAG: M3 family metallopeptidase, partial [Thermomicrobiales bacterium]
MTEVAPIETLPRWDMSVVYPSLDSPEFAAGMSESLRSIDELAALFDAEGIGESRKSAGNDAPVALFERALSLLNQTLERFGIDMSYVYGFTSTNSRDELAQSLQSELRIAGVTLSKLSSRWTAWIGQQDVEGLIANSALAASHAFALRRERTLAEHQMPPGEEALAAELNASGGSAWAKLHDTITSQIQVPVDIEGTLAVLPMSEVRNLALSPHRDVRERAFEAEIGAWRQWATPLAAAMNGIKGEDNTLAARRGWDDQLDLACFQNHIDRATLDAMMGAARAAFPQFRRYLKAKARLIGVERLAWFDMFAPVGDPGRSWEWLDAVGLLEDRFARFSPGLGALMARAVRERWIDAGPRPGKEGGAFCNPLRDDESRILMNFTPSFDSVSTLAHEMGHAYHNVCTAGLTPVQRSVPMT